jgi:hypothetical protein
MTERADEVAELKARLAALEAHSAPAPPAPAKPRSGKLMAAMLWTGAAIIGGLFVLILIGDSLPRESTSERIRQACERSYGEGAAADCQVDLSIRTLEQREAARRAQAARDAGL